MLTDRVFTRRTTLTFAGTTAKKAAVPFAISEGSSVVLQLRVVPVSLAGANQTYSTWVSVDDTALPGEPDTVFFDEARTIVSGATHTAAEQVYKPVGENDFIVAVPQASKTVYVIVELDVLAAAEFEVEIVLGHLGTHTQAVRKTLDVT